MTELWPFGPPRLKPTTYMPMETRKGKIQTRPLTVLSLGLKILSLGLKFLSLGLKILILSRSKCNYFVPSLVFGA